jgi:hypothetical protein
MRHLLVLTVVAATITLAANSTAQADVSAASYQRGVTEVCAGALLFDHAHPQGTRADALAVARDIRASTARRLAHVSTVPVPASLRGLDAEWITTQRRLAAAYARLWIQIYDTIDAARTPSDKVALPARLERLVHAPDPLRHVAGRLELTLHVPDCTGGG